MRGLFGSLYLSWAIWSVIFCFPVETVFVSGCRLHLELGCLTVSAGLDRGLDVADALNCDTVLIIAVNHLVFELTDLVDQDTKFVGDIGHIVVTRLTPN